MKIAERLAELRQLMAHDDIDAYVIATDDFHGSEYVGDYFKEREFMSGFTGSAGTLVVLKDWAGLWTDGRYFLQAAEQLEGSTIELMRIARPDIPTIPEFLAEKIADGGRIGFDGRTISQAFVKEIQEKISSKGISFVWDRDLVDAIWTDRPELSAEPVWELDVEYAGLTRAEKLSMIRRKMHEAGGDMLVLTALDEIAWLLNLRGNDVRCTPVFLSYMLIQEEDAFLYINPGIISNEIKSKLNNLNIILKAYDDIYKDLGQLCNNNTVMADDKSVNYSIIQSIPSTARIIWQPSPVILMKAVKTPVEQQHIRQAHIKDGVVVTRFIHWLKTHIGKERITELGAAAKLEELRRDMDGFIEPSFDSIIAYGRHGAIVHYEPTAETDVEMKPEGLCLADTGGHYIDGTTDVTRTIPLGRLTDEEKRAYTIVLRGHLNLGAARFIEGISGPNLDYLARGPLWENGMDFNHGTGHGVGYILNVHEGPQRINWKIKNPVAFKAGMVVSNEPGLYIEGKFGIRHENLVLVCNGNKNEYGQFMYFDSLTMVPFDKDAIDVSLMSDRELAGLNAYHRKVFEAVSPWFEGEELQWLKEYTAPL